MPHNFKTRTKNKFKVRSESLKTVEANTASNIDKLQDEVISLEDTVIKRLQQKNEKLCEFGNRADAIESSHNAFEQIGRRNNLLISAISGL